MEEIARMLILFGLVIIVIGALLLVIGRVPGIGRLPGDIVIQRDNFSCVFPLATSIVLSILLTLILNLVLRFLNR